MFARFGYMNFNAAEFNENGRDSDSGSLKDFPALIVSAKSMTAVTASAKTVVAVVGGSGTSYVEVGG